MTDDAGPPQRRNEAWRFRVGVLLFVLGLVCPLLFVPLVVATSMPAVSGLLLQGCGQGKTIFTDTAAGLLFFATLSTGGSVIADISFVGTGSSLEPVTVGGSAVVIFNDCTTMQAGV